MFFPPPRCFFNTTDDRRDAVPIAFVSYFTEALHKIATGHSKYKLTRLIAVVVATDVYAGVIRTP